MTATNTPTEFHQAMLDGYQELIKPGYKANYFIQMVQAHSGVEAARRLLRQPNIADGLTRFWELGRLDLSVEAFVLRPENAALFTDEERTLARQHLAELDYTAPWDQPASDASPPAAAKPSGAPSLVERLARAVSNTQGGDARGDDEKVGDSSAFVVIYRADYDAQHYGKTYQFSNYASGDARKLRDALEAFTQGGPPVALIFYRPNPHYAFTAWARATGFTHHQGSRPDETVYVVTLEQVEFPVPLNLKGNAADLVKHLEWLNRGLKTAFNYRAIRRITAADFATITGTVDEPRGELMTIADAAFAILSRAGGGPLHLTAILDRIQAGRRAGRVTRPDAAALACQHLAA